MSPFMGCLLHWLIPVAVPELTPVLLSVWDTVEIIVTTFRFSKAEPTDLESLEIGLESKLRHL